MVSYLTLPPRWFVYSKGMMVGNCEVLRVESVALLSTRKVVWCPLARIIISSSMFKGIWGQTEADLFGESLNLGFFFFLVNILFFLMLFTGVLIYGRLEGS